jgi:hypothetical protein
VCLARAGMPAEQQGERLAGTPLATHDAAQEQAPTAAAAAAAAVASRSALSGAGSVQLGAGRWVE